MHSLVVLLIEFALCQESTTGDYSTVIYDPEPCECVPIPDTDQCYYPVPCSGCLPYDGSIVPDCSKYFDGTLLKQPYYKEHSNNCSRYWECGPQGYTCLLECALCGGPSNSMCDGQWSLTFDPSFQYPIGPVCVWPVDLDCGESLVCDNDLPEYECCHNDDCDFNGYCAFNEDETQTKCIYE